MTDYHVSPRDLQGWVDGDTSPVIAISVEQHLMGCARCRYEVGSWYPTSLRTEAGSGYVRPPDLDVAWRGIRDALEAPEPSLAQRTLTRVGLVESDATMVASSPALRGSWISALTMALVFTFAAAIAGEGERGLAAFLLVAPLVPVFAVALAYGPEASPALEQETATPYPLARLILLRTVAVLAGCLPLAVIAGMFLPEGLPQLWLLPALGFASAVLALSAWMPPVRAASWITFAWTVTIAVAFRRDSAADVLALPYLAVYSVLFAAGPTILVGAVRRRGTLGRISR